MGEGEGLIGKKKVVRTSEWGVEMVTGPENDQNTLYACVKLATIFFN